MKKTLIYCVLLIVLLLPAGTDASGQALTFQCNHVADLPLPVSNPAIVSYKGRFYAAGGNDEKGCCSTFCEFNPLTSSWSVLPDMPEPRSGHGAVIYNNRLLVLGGYRTSGGSTIFEKSISAFDFTMGRWSKIGEMPGGRARFGLAVQAGKILIMGGADESHRATAGAYEYDPARNSWRSGNALPGPRNRLGAAVLDGTLYVLGGEDAAGTTLKTVLKFEPGNGCWSEVPSMSIPRKNFAITRMGPALVVAGGWDQAHGRKTFHSGIEAFDGEKWATIGALRQARDGARAVTSRGKMYVFGGYNGRLLSGIERGEWISREKLWKIDRSLKFHLGFYDEQPIPPCDTRRPPPLGFTKEYTPDITNINLKNFLDLGFRVPPCENPQKYSFFLKFFEYPSHLSSWISTAPILEPLLIFQTGEGDSLAGFLKIGSNVVVKKGYIDTSDRQFTGDHPFPPLLIPAVPFSAPGVSFTPQEFLDRRLPFSSLYVQPISPAKGTEEERAGASAGGVIALHKEIMTLLRKTYRQIKGPDSAQYLYFLDDSECDSTVAPGCVVEVVKIPTSPMVFRNYRELPMPQDPSHIFLTGLLLIHHSCFTLSSPARIVTMDSLNDMEANSGTHVFEVGSVIDTRQ